MELKRHGLYEVTSSYGSGGVTVGINTLFVVADSVSEAIEKFDKFYEKEDRKPVVSAVNLKKHMVVV